MCSSRRPRQLQDPGQRVLQRDAQVQRSFQQSMRIGDQLLRDEAAEMRKVDELADDLLAREHRWASYLLHCRSEPGWLPALPRQKCGRRRRTGVGEHGGGCRPFACKLYRTLTEALFTCSSAQRASEAPTLPGRASGLPTVLQGAPTGGAT